MTTEVDKLNDNRESRIDYRINHPITTDQFIALLQQCTLGERRPLDNRSCMAGMLEHGNLTVTAWDSDKLVGIARSVTDFHYACYLSELAVAESHQQQGIGKVLQQITRQQLGTHCKLILIAAPAANDYYPQLGYSHNDRCWVLDAESRDNAPPGD